jgi:hypothetical protein
MNTNRLINMGLNLLMRYGLKYFMKGKKVDPNAKRAADAMKATRRIGRM